MTNEQEKQEEQEIKAEGPKSLESDNKVVTIKPEEESIEYRHYDSNDLMKVRSYALKVDIVKDENGNPKEETTPDMGELQKIYIICGIKSASFFSDVIDENLGITSTIFKRRYEQEFRKIDIKIVDKLYKEVTDFNHVEDQSQLQKN